MKHAILAFISISFFFLMDFGCFKLDISEEYFSSQTCNPNEHQNFNQFFDPFYQMVDAFPPSFDGFSQSSKSFSLPSDEFMVPSEGIQNMVLPCYFTQGAIGDHVVEQNLSRVPMAYGSLEQTPFSFGYRNEFSNRINNKLEMEANDVKKKPISKNISGGREQKKTNVVKGQWTHEEDKLLISLVEKYGLRKWSQIAKMLTGRIGKQCRERWHNHLRPNIKKDTWSEEEDKVLIQAHTEVGNKWAEIAKRLPGRTENSIKNHWNATKRRQFARRRCRNTKNPKSGVLLQNYIQSLALNSPPPSSRASKRKPVKDSGGRGSSSNSSKPILSSVVLNEAGAADVDLAPAVSAGGGDDFCDVMANLLFEGEMKVGAAGELSERQMFDVGYLLDQLGCDEGFEMEVEWDDIAAAMTAVPSCCEDVKPDLDLSQSSVSSNDDVATPEETKW